MKILILAGRGGGRNTALDPVMDIVDFTAAAGEPIAQCLFRRPTRAHRVLLRRL